jgi:hypothetical protein
MPRGERFLPGPIPVSWLRLARKRLRYEDFYVALTLWAARRIHLKRGGGPFPFTSGEAAIWGIGDRLKRNALGRIEAAGLICIEHGPGKAPRITILEVDKDAVCASAPADVFLVKP